MNLNDSDLLRVETDAVTNPDARDLPRSDPGPDRVRASRESGSRPRDTL